MFRKVGAIVVPAAILVGSAGAQTVNALVYDSGGAVLNVRGLQYGAKGDLKTVKDGSMTSGSAILTSATANWVAGDVGKSITVDSAGPSGALLVATISTRTSATQVTLATGASRTVSGRIVMWGTNDSPAIQSALTHAIGRGGG